MDKIRTILNEKNLWPVGGAVLVALFLVTRLLFLDADLPPLGVGGYASLDEGIHAKLALNYMDYGTIDPNATDTDGMVYYETGQVINDVIGNAFIVIGLLTIGDTYYGLRVPYVVINALNMLFLGMILFRLRRDYGKKDRLESNVILFILLYLVMDFCFLMSARVIENSPVRGLFVQLTVLALLFIKNLRPKFFVMSFLATASILFVYMSNLYLLFAVALLCVFYFYRHGKKDGVQASLFALLGFASCFLLSELYYNKIWGIGTVANLLATFYAFSHMNSYIYDVYASGFSVVKNVTKFISASPFLYSLPVLYGMFIVFIPLLSYLKKEKDENISFFLFICLGLFLQTTAASDWITRKEIMIYPVYWYILYVAWLKRDVIRDCIASHAWWGRFKLQYYVCAIAVCTGVVAFRLYIIRNGSISDFANVDKYILLLPCVAIGLNFFWNLGKAELFTHIRSMIVPLFALSFLVNLYFDYIYIYRAPTYTDYAVANALRKYDGKYFFGEICGGLSVYNNIKPFSNFNKIIEGYMVVRPDSFYFFYGDDYKSDTRFVIDNILFADSDYTIVPVEHFDRECVSFGNKRPLAVYKLISKTDVKDYYHERSAYYEKVREEAEAIQLEILRENDIARENGETDFDERSLDDILKDMGMEYWERQAIYNGCFDYYEDKEVESELQEYDLEKRKAEEEKYRKKSVDWDRDRTKMIENLSRIPF